MKTHTAYIQVPCSERLPKEAFWYHTSQGKLYYDSGNWYTSLTNEIFIYPTWWLEKREDVIVMTKEELANSIVDLINDCEIPIPIGELMNSDNTHLTKKQYGLVLLENLCIEIKEKLCKS